VNRRALRAHNKRDEQRNDDAMTINETIDAIKNAINACNDFDATTTRAFDCEQTQLIIDNVARDAIMITIVVALRNNVSTH